MGYLEGKVVLITGGGTGIGSAAAAACAREGAEVMVSGRREAPLRATAEAIRAGGGEASHLAADVTVEGDVERLVQAAVERYGRLDCAFNNAGMTGSGRLLAEYEREEWERLIAVNLTGVWLCMKHEIPRMLEGGGGVIINNSSIASLRGYNAEPVYAAAKHGVNGLTQSAAVQYARKGIRVNAICPGWIETPLTDPFPDFGATVVSRTPLRRAGTPAEVAELVAWLCSNAASYVTGALLPVDGGLSARI